MEPQSRSYSIEEHNVALAGALRTLDRFLGAAVNSQAQALGPASLLDPWRGLHLDRCDVERLLAPGSLAELACDGIADELGVAAHAVPLLHAVATTESLSDADLALLLIVIAPDVDLKYERIYGYLQDDITRKRATPDLVANLLAVDAEQRLRILARLDCACPADASGSDRFDRRLRHSVACQTLGGRRDLAQSAHRPGSARIRRWPAARD